MTPLRILAALLLLTLLVGCHDEGNVWDGRMPMSNEEVSAAADYCWLHHTTPFPYRNSKGEIVKIECEPKP